MKQVFTMLLAVIVCFAATITTAESATYKGARKCKVCHRKVYKIWEQTKHSKAFDSLTEAEKKDPKCIECHTTNNDPNLPGVHCEACHGPGSKYASPKIMNKKKWKADPEAHKKMAVEAGLIVAPNEANCKKCHNERSPHYKGFEFKTRYEEIKHKN